MTVKGVGWWVSQSQNKGSKRCRRFLKTASHICIPSQDAQSWSVCLSPHMASSLVKG